MSGVVFLFIVSRASIAEILPWGAVIAQTVGRSEVIQ